MAKVLPIYVKQIGSVYSAIASKIEDLLFELNETQKTVDKDTIKLTRSIISFLDRLKKSVIIEGISARKELPAEKKQHFLSSIQTELDQIRDLESFLVLSERSSTPAIISKINELYRAIKLEIERQEALAA